VIADITPPFAQKQKGPADSGGAPDDRNLFAYQRMRCPASPPRMVVASFKPSIEYECAYVIQLFYECRIRLVNLQTLSQAANLC
jgi:hypothetical protein